MTYETYTDRGGRRLTSVGLTQARPNKMCIAYGEVNPACTWVLYTLAVPLKLVQLGYKYVCMYLAEAPPLLNGIDNISNTKLFTE